MRVIILCRFDKSEHIYINPFINTPFRNYPQNILYGEVSNCEFKYSIYLLIYSCDLLSASTKLNWFLFLFYFILITDQFCVYNHNFTHITPFQIRVKKQIWIALLWFVGFDFICLTPFSLCWIPFMEVFETSGGNVGWD